MAVLILSLAMWPFGGVRDVPGRSHAVGSDVCIYQVLLQVPHEAEDAVFGDAVVRKDEGGEAFKAPC